MHSVGPLTAAKKRIETACFSDPSVQLESQPGEELLLKGQGSLILSSTVLQLLEMSKVCLIVIDGWGISDASEGVYPFVYDARRFISLCVRNHRNLHGHVYCNYTSHAGRCS